MPSADEARPAFEERLRMLTAVVEALEKGDLSLEQAIESFERGKRLHQELLAELAAYEKRLERLLSAGDGTDTLAPMAERCGPARGGGEEDGDPA